MRRVEDVAEPKRIANRMRKNIVRMIGEAGSGHPGGSLSATELVTVLLFNVMRHDPTRPAWPDRDRFILSKGHACPVLYCAYAESGYIEPASLTTLRKLDSPLQPSRDLRAFRADAADGAKSTEGSISEAESVPGHGTKLQLVFPMGGPEGSQPNPVRATIPIRTKFLASTGGAKP